MKNKVGLWMYSNEGGDKVQSKLKKKLEEKGLHVFNDFDLRNTYVKDGLVYTGNGFNLSSLDLLFHMNADERNNHQTHVLKALELSGVEVINNLSAHSLAADKFYTNLLLRKNGVKVPDSVLVDSHIGFEELSALVNGWEGIVIKPRFSAGGIGIVKVNTIGELYDYFGMMKLYFDNVYLERFIPFKDHDYRVEILDSEVIGCYSRNKGHEFKTNIHQGGHHIHAGDYSEAIELAQKAVEVIGVETSIVDMVKHQVTGEYYVLEVNDSMGIFIGALQKDKRNFRYRPIPEECQFDDKKIDMLANYVAERLAASDE